MKIGTLVKLSAYGEGKRRNRGLDGLLGVITEANKPNQRKVLPEGWVLVSWNLGSGGIVERPQPVKDIKVAK